MPKKNNHLKNVFSVAKYRAHGYHWIRDSDWFCIYSRCVKPKTKSVVTLVMFTFACIICT